MDWYVLQVMTGKEDEYRTLAKTRVPPECAGTLYLPTRRLPIRRGGKVRIEDKPVFPGYLFVATDTLTPQGAGAYRRVPGFVRWLGGDNGPAILRDSDLEILQVLLGHGEILGLSRAKFNAEQRIQVVDGPLKGLEGRIIRVDKRKQRARVRLDMYRNSFEVDFGYELITDAAKEPPRHE